jgi:hypothetical protein
MTWLLHTQLAKVQSFALSLCPFSFNENFQIIDLNLEKPQAEQEGSIFQK